MRAGVDKFIRRADWPLALTTLVLLGIGLVAVWSFAPAGSGLFGRQLLWVGLGLAAFAAFSFLDYRLFKNHGILLVVLYVITLAALAALLAFAPQTRGVRAWFEIGPFSVQPVELAKLVLVLVLAKYFSRRHVEIARPLHLVISGLYVGAAALFVLLQPDFGSTLILIAVWLAVVLFSGIRLRHLAMFFLLVAIAGGLAWTSLFAPYQRERIVAFLDPYRDPEGAGYSTIQAMVAAGSGRIAGKGIGYGSQSHLAFLPEAETDFVFAAFAEETGFVGAALVLALFGVLGWRLVNIGLAAQDNFSKLYVIGFSSFLFAGVLIHVGVNLGMLPVTGIGLPLVSYGGSNLLVTLAGLGIAESIRIHSRPEIG